MRDDLIAAAAIEGPGADIFLQPERELVPDLADAETVDVVAGGHLKHGEAADLGNVFRLFDEGDLRAQFHIRKSKGAGACAAGGIVDNDVRALFPD